MTDFPDETPPSAAAADWISRILAASATMLLPGLAGGWLDTRWGTNFLALVGFLLGVSLGTWYLIVVTQDDTKRGQSGSERKRDSEDE